MVGEDVVDWTGKIYRSSIVGSLGEWMNENGNKMED
jgi:hypothetical protein